MLKILLENKYVDLLFIYIRLKDIKQNLFGKFLFLLIKSVSHLQGNGQTFVQRSTLEPEKSGHLKEVPDKIEI
jgi:hypothetical protein